MPNPLELLAKLKASKNPDAGVLRHMAETGADLTKPHKPDFAFEAATRRSAEAIATELDAQGYEVEVYEPDNENPNYQIVGKRIMILDLRTLNLLSEQFEELADRHNASYDGWGAEIVE